MARKRARRIDVIDNKARCPFCYRVVQFKLADGIGEQYVPINPCKHFVNVFRNRMGGHLTSRFIYPSQDQTDS